MSGELGRLFRARFGRQSQVRVRSPGRVNLIGEHTDYNDVLIFPAAINRYVTLLASARADSRVQAYSLASSQHCSFETQRVEYDPATPGSNHILGVLQQYQNRGMRVPGMDLMVGGYLPVVA